MRFFLISILLCLLSCQSEKEKYELIQFGKTQKPISANDAVLIEIKEGGKVNYEVVYPSKHKELFEILIDLELGDLIELKEDVGSFKEGFLIEVKGVRIKDYVLTINDGFNQFSSQEYKDIASYIFNSKEEYELLGGMFVRKELLSSSGKKGVKNSLYKVAMECELLSGKQVYSTAKSSTLFEFNKSMPGQITEGLGIIIDKMEEGDEFTVIIPSKLSFGATGVEGLVPPHSPLKYELKLIEIII